MNKIFDSLRRINVSFPFITILSLVASSPKVKKKKKKKKNKAYNQKQNSFKYRFKLVKSK
ncbi:hypothetical protein BLOT_014707 [Blomia tropicalis]|nr:hypothetical protein BLOT_014707 [Blomia tropicalis]